MPLLSQIIGAIIFLPIIGFYSYVLGPLLKITLAPAAVFVLLLILGVEDGVKPLLEEMRKQDQGSGSTNRPKSAPSTKA